MAVRAADWDRGLPTPGIDQIEALVCELVQSLTPDAAAVGRNRGRPPVLPATLLWAGLLVCVLRRAPSQLALWRLLSSRGLWGYPAVPVTDDAVYKRLAHDGPAAMAGLFGGLTQLLSERLTPVAATDLAPFATEVVALDETTLDPVARRLPVLRGAPPGDAQLLPGKLAGVFDIRRQLWRTLVHVPNPQQNEKAGARALVAHLPTGSLILADLGYFGFRWFDELTAAHHFWISRLRAKTSYELLHVFYQDEQTLDALVWLGAHRADRARHAVRLVEFRVGATTHRYLTNVDDPQRLSIAAIARLYARRWDIELAVNLVKTHLGLHLLWSSKPAVILTQIWAVLIIAQVLQALRLLIAHAAGVDPFEVSLPLLITYLPQYAARHADPLAAFLRDAPTLRFIRPSRRVQIRAPAIPAHLLIPRPDGLCLVRTPRYAQRKCRSAPQFAN